MPLGPTISGSIEGLRAVGSPNLYADYVMFDYEKFSDVTAGAALGAEPLYHFDAVVLRAYLPFWF